MKHGCNTYTQRCYNNRSYNSKQWGFSTISFSLILTCECCLIDCYNNCVIIEAVSNYSYTGEGVVGEGRWSVDCHRVNSIKTSAEVSVPQFTFSCLVDGIIHCTTVSTGI